jgi:hypothetical protein
VREGSHLDGFGPGSDDEVDAGGIGHARNVALEAVCVSSGFSTARYPSSQVRAVFDSAHHRRAQTPGGGGERGQCCPRRSISRNVTIMILASSQSDQFAM